MSIIRTQESVITETLHHIASHDIFTSQRHILHHNDIYYILITYITSTLNHSSVCLNTTTGNLNLKYIMFSHHFK